MIQQPQQPQQHKQLRRRRMLLRTVTVLQIIRIVVGTLYDTTGSTIINVAAFQIRTYQHPFHLDPATTTIINHPYSLHYPIVQ